MKPIANQRREVCNKYVSIIDGPMPLVFLHFYYIGWIELYGLSKVHGHYPQYLELLTQCIENVIELFKQLTKLFFIIHLPQ